MNGGFPVDKFVHFCFLLILRAAISVSVAVSMPVSISISVFVAVILFSFSFFFLKLAQEIALILIECSSATNRIANCFAAAAAVACCLLIFMRACRMRHASHTHTSRLSRLQATAATPTPQRHLNDFH